MSELDELKKHTRLLKKILKILLKPYRESDLTHEGLPVEE